ncbi:unnamed protein product, partial [Chrysoparadoxa australica]
MPGKRKRPKAKGEREALAEIFSRLDGPNWERSAGWDKSPPSTTSPQIPPSDWQGVSVDAAGRVTALELSRNKLSGRLESVEAALLCLPCLEQLWLAENNLTGPLPASLATELPLLSVLDLGSNQLEGMKPPEYEARSPKLSWFDVSGNKLTAFFQYTPVNRSNEQPMQAGGDTYRECLARTTVVPETKAKPPIWQVHEVPGVVSQEEAAAIVTEAEHHIKTQGQGWEVSRHRQYQTTDLDVGTSSPRLLELCNAVLEHRLLPLLAELFPFKVSDLVVDDLFVVKYSADAGEQRALKGHRDDSELSFVMLLNVGFTGGGTRFLEAGPSCIVAPRAAGTAAVFCGRQLHEGLEVTLGTRFILAGFIKVHPSTQE